jgi:energy-coupling factor transporter ATP-binding protein EcfA2
MPALPFSHITVDNFRGLHALEVDDLRTINLLVGGNNSGKTSVLEAIALLANPVSGDEWLQVVRRRDFGRLDESFVMSLRWCFTQGLGLSGAEPEVNEFQCQFRVKGAHPLRAMKSVYREFFAEVKQKELGFSKARYNALMNDATVELNAKTCTIDSLLEWSGEVPNQLDLPSQASTLRVSELMSPVMASLLGRGGVRPSKNGLNYAALLPYSYQLNTLQVSTRSKQLFFDDNSLLLDLLRQFDKDVINVEVASFAGLRPAIYIKHAKLGVAPLSVFGDAMRRCLLLATTMTSLGRGGVLLLDEVEVGIHTDALPRVFKWLADAAKQLEIQVIATTHSLEVLDALLASDLGEDDLAAYQLKQTEERTECKRFAGAALKRLRYERGLDIR